MFLRGVLMGSYGFLWVLMSSYGFWRFAGFGGTLEFGDFGRL